MEPEFWHRVWKEDLLGFQLEQPHELLVKHGNCFQAKTAVFVPLCGKSPDMHYLAQHHAVVGAELSPIACRDFFVEANLPVQIIDSSTYVHGQICLHQGDIFELEPSRVSHCQQIYDRAALIALPEELRRQYVDWLQRAIPKATLLLLTVVYPPSEMQGPPFSIDETEIKSLFRHCKFELLDERDLTGKYFARRKLPTSSLIEQVWLITWDFT